MSISKPFFLVCIYVMLSPFALWAQQKSIKTQNIAAQTYAVFTENKGQFRDQNNNFRNDVKYIYAANGLKIIFKQNGLSYEFYRFKDDQQTVSESSLSAITNKMLPGKLKNAKISNIEIHRVDVDFKHANQNTTLLAEDKTSTSQNYYNGHAPENGILGVGNFKKLIYKNLWPNIDLVFYAKNGHALKYDIVVHPGGKLQDIQFKYHGAGNIVLQNGVLQLQTMLGYANETIPLSYQDETKERKHIRYKLDKNTISFRGNYDKDKTLIIDPLLGWASYFGGEEEEIMTCIVKDRTGNLYVCGATTSATGIATTGAHQTILTHKFATDVFVAKLDENGNKLWATYYGGDEADQAVNVALDTFGNVFLSGFTRSTTGIATQGAYQETYAGGGEDIYIAKFTPEGKRLWGTYFGGDGFEIAHVSIDKFNNIYVGGGTTTQTGMATGNAFRPKYMGGTSDAFLAKFDSTFSKKLWLTYFGGNNQDFGYVIVFDRSGNLYMTGFTESTINLASPGAHQTTFTGASGFLDAFLVKFSPAGNRLWSTYYGGSSTEYGNSIATDKFNNIYLAGETSSETNIASPGAHQTTLFKGEYWYDAFLAKFDSTGVRQWGTYYGGKETDLGQQVSTDTFGNVFLAGWTRSENYISTVDAHQVQHGGFYRDNYDVFLAKFGVDGKRKWGTYYGGEKDDHVLDMMTDASGNTYMVGGTNSKTLVATKDAYQPNLTGIGDAFMAKFERGAVHDIAMDTVHIPNSICVNDSFAFSAVLAKTNQYKPDSFVKFRIEITGPDTLILADSLSDTLFNYAADSFLINYKYAFAKPGKYNIKAFFTTPDENPWNDTVTASIMVYTKPDVNFSSIISGSVVHFNTSDTTLAEYNWSFGDGDSSLLKKPFHQYQDTGIYHVKLWVKNAGGCSQLLEDSIHIITNVGVVAEPENSFKINLYPNPFSVETSLEIILLNKSNVNISLVDLYGRQISLVQNKNLDAGKHIYSIQAAHLNLQSGIYFIKTEINGFVSYRKVVRN